MLHCFYVDTAVNSFTAAPKTPQQLQVDRAVFLIGQAFDADERENLEEALELYTNAAEICIQVVSVKFLIML